MAHVSYTDPTQSSDIASAHARVAGERGQVGNLFRSMAHAPMLVHGFESFSHTIRKELPLPYGLFALVTLRTVQALGDNYEWRRCLAIALDIGIPEAKIGDLWNWQQSSQFSPPEKSALSIVDEHFKMTSPLEPAVETAKAHLSEAEIVSVCAVMGWFAFCGALTMPLGLSLDDPDTELAVPLEARRPDISQEETEWTKP